ncbi:MAG: ImmA/IrrE family metallo-endopeptidase [Dehalococcoidia bacterium]
MLPEKLNIFGIEYAIRQDKDEYLDASGSLGEIIYAQQEIYIKSTVSDDRKVKVLVHEVSHGILFEVGAIKNGTDEATVNFVSICLHQFIKNNDFAWVK